MKKQKKQMFILLMMLFILAAGYFGLKAYNKNAANKQDDIMENISVMGLEAGSVQGFTYTYEGETYTFEKEGDDWIYTADSAVDIREVTLNLMAQRIEEMTTEDVIENVTDLEQYGLAEPSQTVEIVTADHTYTLCIGNYNSTISRYYIYVDDETTVYTVSSAIATNFQKSLDDVKEEAEEEVETIEQETETAE